MRGHLKSRSRGSWSIVLDLMDPATGKRRRKWHTFRGTRKEAENELAKLITQIKGGTYIVSEKISVGEFLDGWLKTAKQQVAPRTYERYAEIVEKNIKPLLGSVLVSRLLPQNITDAYEKALTVGTTANGPLSPRSVTHIHRILRRALGPIRWQRLHQSSEDNIVKPPKVERRKINAPSLSEAETTLAKLRSYRVFVPALLACRGGLRRGEIAAQRWRDLDAETGVLSIAQTAEETKAGIRYKETKNKLGRAVQLDGDTLEELRAWKLRQAEELLRLGVRASPETFICTTALGGGWYPNSITHEFVKAVAVEKLPRLRFHDLRHAHASHMLAKGIHPKIVSERLGHSKIGITMDLYSHTIPTLQTDAVAIMEAAYKAAKKPA